MPIKSIFSVSKSAGPPGTETGNQTGSGAGSWTGSDPYRTNRRVPAVQASPHHFQRRFQLSLPLPPQPTPNRAQEPKRHVSPVGKRKFSNNLCLNDLILRSKVQLTKMSFTGPHQLQIRLWNFSKDLYLQGRGGYKNGKWLPITLESGCLQHIRLNGKVPIIL